MSPAAAEGASERASLTGVVSRGVVWMTAQAMGGKVLGLLSQVALARLLLPVDFGNVALAYTVSAVGGLILQAGLADILVRRQRRSRLWLSSAFWLSLLMGAVAAVLTAAGAPILAWLYRAPAVEGLVYVLAANALAVSLASVPEALMRMTLAFRFMAILGFAANALTVILSVLLAWATPLGAYAFVVPILVVSTVRLAVLWARFPVRVTLSPQMRRWPSMVRDGLLLFGFAICSTITLQADYVILGLFENAREVGYYFVAFNLSTQTVQLLGMNLAAVLLPALAQMNAEPARQDRAYLAALRLLAFGGVPFCFLQAALAGPIISLVFGAKWLPAAPLLQLLSLGMAWLLYGWQAGAVLKAQGRFATLLRYGVISVVIFVLPVTAAAWLGSVREVAASVALSFALMAILSNVMALWRNKQGLRTLAILFTGPMALSALAVVPALIVQSVWFAPLWQSYGQAVASFVVLAAGSALSGIAYVLLLMLFARGVWTSLLEQFGAQLRNFALRRKLA